MFLKLLVPLICFVNFQLAIATINCDYYVSELQGYSCRLTIDNPDGLNNYAGISGTHVAGFSDVDVLYVYNTVGSISRNVPMIICKQFTRLRRVYLQSAGIQRIDDSSFRNCANLEYLSFFNNSLSVLEQNSFVGNQNLERLLFVKTDIEELPANIFSPLVRMDTLWILESSLKILHSESFGDLPNLKIAHFNFNQINAIDERLIDNTGIVEVFMPGNVCFGGMVNDGTPTRSHLREVLARCFENYEILANGKFA